MEARVIQPPPFDVVVHDEDRTRRVTAAGDLDLAAVSLLEAAFDVDSDVTISLDFGAVAFMDSSALGAVVRGIRDRPQVAMLASDPVRRVLEMTSTVDLFLLS